MEPLKDHIEGKKTLNVSELLIAYLEQIGVEYVYGIPGGAIEPVYNALAKSERSGGPRPIVARHEVGAAFMADGYATYSGKLGVCCGTTGPGATNLVTGAASAFANRVPLLVITAQTELSNFGRGAFQESSCTGINTVGMFEFCTRFNTLVSHHKQFEQKFLTAMLSAFGSPHGPVHLSIPLDVLRADTGLTEPQYDLKKLLQKPELSDKNAVSQLVDRLKSSQTNVFLIGEGAINGIEAVLHAASLLNANIVTTPHGKGLVSPYHPKYQGVIGFAGHQSAYQTLKNPEIDNVIAVGTNFSEWASNGWDPHVVLSKRLVHVDAEANNFHFTPMAKLHVRGNIKSVFEQVSEELIAAGTVESNQAAVEEQIKSIEAKMRAKEVIAPEIFVDRKESVMDDSAPVKPQYLMHRLPALLPSSTRFLADTGNSFAWAIHYLHPYDRRLKGPRNSCGGLFRTCLEFASMGWAIGCAVGTSQALNKQPVVCITGDGSVLMSGQEISVCVQEKLPVIFVVLNDSALGMVKHGQRLAKAEPVGFEIPFTDFSMLAKSMGAQGYVIEAGSDLEDINFDAIIKGDTPVLLDVRIDKDEVPPIGMRIDTLQSGNE